MNLLGHSLPCFQTSGKIYLIQELALGTDNPDIGGGCIFDMKKADAYRHFSTIDGRHPLREAIPDGYIDYSARRRREGSVFYFNFPLAREIGLIPKGHPDDMNAALKRVLLDTFSIQIINEYDIEHDLKVPARDRLSGQYMATRYLQIQHPSKRGTTSGDGRGIWNGFFKGRQGVWDISSCGTGTTALSPAVANEGRFVQTGDDNVSYGNGRACLWDGVCAAIMSEIYHHSSIATERTLAIISFPDGSAINVRASRNLLRPAHFFMHIKQNNLSALEGLIEYYIDRQVTNGDWPLVSGRAARYRCFIDAVTRDFARMAARFEADYIFCWLDWDGDNILMDGGIIDYGSLRQFGLFHHEYRYDDVDRMSTTITEQKNKARYIVQTFVQIVDALLHGRKKNIKSYAGHKTLRLFDSLFACAKSECFLYRMGVDPVIFDSLLESRAVNKALKQMRQPYDYFERAKSSKGVYPVSDGVSWDAIFCMRDCMREMPGVLLDGEGRLSSSAFIEMIRSRYACDADVRLTPYLGRGVHRFQKNYKQLLEAIAVVSDRSLAELLLTVRDRSALINRIDRITGDAIIHVAEQLIEASRSLSHKKTLIMFNNFVDTQILSPEYWAGLPPSQRVYFTGNQHNNSLKHNPGHYQQMLKMVVDHREGL